jgi:hypothetical protein
VAPRCFCTRLLLCENPSKAVPDKEFGFTRFVVHLPGASKVRHRHAVEPRGSSQINGPRFRVIGADPH